MPTGPSNRRPIVREAFPRLRHDLCIDTIFGFYAPDGTPAHIVTRRNREINRALALPGPRDRIAALKKVPAPVTPAQFHAESPQDGQRFGHLVRERKMVENRCA